MTSTRRSTILFAGFIDGPTHVRVACDGEPQYRQFGSPLPRLMIDEQYELLGAAIFRLAIRPDIAGLHRFLRPAGQGLSHVSAVR
jgi:hypothetical protein